MCFWLWFEVPYVFCVCRIIWIFNNKYMGIAQHLKINYGSSKITNLIKLKRRRRKWEKHYKLYLFFYFLFFFFSASFSFSFFLSLLIFRSFFVFWRSSFLPQRQSLIFLNFFPSSTCSPFSCHRSGPIPSYPIFLDGHIDAWPYVFLESLWWYLKTKNILKK